MKNSMHYLVIASIAVGLLMGPSFQARAGGRTLVPTEFPSRLQQDSNELRIAVTPPEYDDVGSILKSMGWAYTEIGLDVLQDYDALSQFDVIFITCSEQAQLYSGFPEYHGDENIANLERFVREGGTLYTSDYTYAFVDYAFPGFVRFSGGSDLGKPQTVAASTVDAGLTQSLGGPTLPILFDTPGWVSIESVSEDVTVLLSADFTSIGDVLLSDRPIAVSFSYGDGRVVYAAFHDGVQAPEFAGRFLAYAADLGVSENFPTEPAPTAEASPISPGAPTTFRTPLYAGIGFGLCLCGLLTAALIVGVVVLLRRRRA